MSRAVRWARVVLINLLLTVILLALVEGVSSLVLAGHSIVMDEPLRERVHTEFDEELGWVNLPSFYDADVYGPGVAMTTNSQRFRNKLDIAKEIPPGKVRVVCSGDSFTLGYGVDDDHTWCHLLTELDPRLESVNLGQGGYGVDQAYLWYRRNHEVFAHDIQLFAFITNDFTRMQRDTFGYYSKPFLTLEGDRITIANTPLSKTLYRAPRLIAARTALKELGVVRMLRGEWRTPSTKSQTPQPPERYQQTEQVVSRIFAELKVANEAKNAQLVFVYLPTQNDFMGRHSETAHWHRFVHAEAERQGIPLIDIVEAMRGLPPLSVDPLYDGHYSPAGNRWVAELLVERLREIPELAGRLAPGTGSEHAGTKDEGAKEKGGAELRP